MLLLKIIIVVYGDGYEYEVERDERAAFLRASKLDRFRIEQAKQPVKKRRLEVSQEDSASSSNESEDDEYMEELAERVSDLLYNLDGICNNLLIDFKGYTTEPPPDILESEKLYHSIMLDTWEDDIIWDEKDESNSDEEKQMM